jgi:serine/threonine protein kinase
MLTNFSTHLGTMLYMAPEIVTDEGHDYSADIWSLGILLLEIMVNLDVNKSEKALLTALGKYRTRLLKNNLPTRLQIYKEMIGKDHDPRLCTLVFECLDYQPEQRPSAEEIVSFIRVMQYQIY